MDSADPVVPPDAESPAPVVPPGSPADIAHEPAAGELVSAPPAAGFGVAFGLLLALAVGVGLRLGWAWALRDHISEWESDGFVWTLLGRPFDALNRLRAPGAPWLLGRLAEVLDIGGILAVRALCVALSVLGLVTALIAAGSLARLTDLTQRSMLRAAAWMTWIWALHPTLVASSVSPAPELLTGACAALLVAGVAWRGAGGGVAAWVFSCAAASGLVLTGGTAWVAVLVVGLLVYLAPVPRPLPAVGALLLVAVACVVGAWVQAGDDPERPWLPDTAPVHSLLALGPHAERSWAQTSASVDIREQEVLDLLVDDVQAEPLMLAKGWLGRLAFEQLGTERFRPVFERLAPDWVEVADGGSSPTLPLGLWDLFLRGGLVLFALTVLGIARPKSESAWPRAALVVGALVAVLLLVAGAIGPFALAPVDLVLLGMAGAGIVGTDPRRPWIRRVAFVVGGGMLCTLLLVGGWRPRPLPAWTTELTHIHGDGAALVPLLTDEGLQAADAPARAAGLLMQPNAPLLRMPRHAHTLAQLALERDPQSPTVNELYVRSLVENGRFEQAARLAEAVHTANRSDIRARVFFEWVLDEQRRQRAPRDR